MREQLTAIAPCPRCGDDITAENWLNAWKTDERVPLVTVAVACPCGMQGTMNIPEGKFDELHDEYAARVDAMRDEAERMTHRVRSHMGREVAHFRTLLDEVDTVADIVEWA